MPTPLALGSPGAVTRKTVLTLGKSRTINVSQAEEDRSAKGELRPQSAESPLRCSGDHVVTDELNALAKSSTNDQITQSCVSAGVDLAGRGDIAVVATGRHLRSSDQRPSRDG